MTFDTWIYAKPGEWGALSNEDAPFSYAHSNAITGNSRKHNSRDTRQP